MKILISIVSWNYLSRLEKEIPFLMKDIGKNDFVVVFETGKKKTDFSYSNPQLAIRNCNNNLGFAAVHEIAVSEMKTKQFDGLLILNPDIEIPNTIITRLKNCIEKTANSCIIGAPIYNLRNNQLTLEYGGFPIVESVKNVLNSASYDFNSKEFKITNDSYVVRDLHGSFVYFPRTVIDKNGWMDTSYFLYGEENEYLYRLAKAGVLATIFTELAILHENGGTFSFNDDLKNIREYYKTRNGLFNNIKFFGLKAYFYLNFFFLFKYFIGRYILRKSSFRENDLNFYNFLGHIHFLKGKRGKVFDPNDYVE